LAFVPYGAALSNLLITDKHGQELDIVTGFDNATAYTLDKGHPYFGGIVGRYANRIKNSTFSIDGTKYHILPNDHRTEQSPEGVDTLHGGPNGWDWRNFTVVSHTDASITFEIIDPDGEQGFPGDVRSLITYTVKGNRWELEMSAVALTKKTPIMISSHVYWNLDGFKNKETDSALEHVLHMPYAGSRVEVDGILIPTGNLLANEQGGANDFWSQPRKLGFAFEKPELQGNCGTGCTGYGEFLFYPFIFPLVLLFSISQK
jgi:aldose 1-epimerase